ncbi:MAG: hypothetical protein NVS2B16_03690 [Chloroflexota bacterium]
MGRPRYGVREEIKETIESFYRALSNKNMKAVDSVWAQVSYAAVAGRSGDLQQGWDKVRLYWEERFHRLSDTTVKVKLASMVCHAVGDVAWISGVEVRSVSTSDSSWQERLRVTCILERKGTGWQIVQYHASMPAQHVPALASAS